MAGSRSLFGILAFTFVACSRPSPPVPPAMGGGHYNRFAVQAEPLDIGEASAGSMLWNGGDYGETLRPLPLSWSDAARERPIFIAEFGDGRSDRRWICVELDESRRYAWLVAYVLTDYGEFPVMALDETRLSLDAAELRFEIVARHGGASSHETWRGAIALPQD